MLPRDAGRRAQVNTLTVDKAFIDRTIAVLPMLTGSVRDIRLGLSLVLGVTRSVGYISERLTAAGLTDHVWTMDELLSFRVPPRSMWKTS